MLGPKKFCLCKLTFGSTLVCGSEDAVVDTLLQKTISLGSEGLNTVITLGFLFAFMMMMTVFFLFFFFELWDSYGKIIF